MLSGIWSIFRGGSEHSPDEDDDTAPDGQQINDFSHVQRLEQKRIDVRRKTYSIEPHEGGPPITGLALSGGGIRSATFSLGILQALSRHRILPRIDYLSTVSGGSYIGSFLGALLVPPEKRGGEPHSRQDQNDLALTPLQSNPGRQAIKQLRESGRYLTPRGTSDAFYGAAIVLRNWAALQMVIGSVAFLLFWAVLLIHDLAAPPLAEDAGAFNPVLAIGLAVAVTGFLSCGTAYWLTKREWIQAARWIRALSNLFLWVMAILAVLSAVAACRYWQSDTGAMAAGFGLLAVMLVGAIIAYGLAEWSAGELVGGHPNNPDLLIAAEDRVRTKLSRWMSTALIAVLAVAGLLLVDALGYQFYRSIVGIRTLFASGEDLWSKTGTLLKDYWPMLSAAIPVLLTVTSHFALRRDDPKSRLAKLPLASPTLIGFIVLGFWLMLWSAAAHAAFALFPAHWSITVGLVLALVVVSFCYSFINLSSLSTFYAARLQRAYIGASTPTRSFGSDENIAGDRIRLQTYYAKENRAPLHLINVTIAQTKAARSNIIARDRKGKPMHLSPAGVVFEGETPGEVKSMHRNAGEELPLSNWIAISGAAVSTAVGARSSLGLSLLATLTNVRLGYWWKEQRSRSTPRPGLLAGEFGNTVQAYLLDEMRGRFIGTAGKRWYLTDGGHFENTGAYVLLQREVDYIIMSDNGADPDYVFDDIIRLINRAQNDLGVKISFLDAPALNTRLPGNTPLRQCFGAYSELSGPPKQGAPLTPFAALAEIAYTSGKTGTMLVIKPRLTFTEPPELLAYHRRTENLTFPQQPTTDLFFDEDQWEAYRRLGEIIGDRLFGEVTTDGSWCPARGLVLPPQPPPAAQTPPGPNPPPPPPPSPAPAAPAKRAARVRRPPAS